jgi:hypothetical protein
MPASWSIGDKSVSAVVLTVVGTCIFSGQQGDTPSPMKKNQKPFVDDQRSDVCAEVAFIMTKKLWVARHCLQKMYK